MAKTLYDKYRGEVKTLFNYPSVKLVSDGDICLYLKKVTFAQSKTTDAFRRVRAELKKDKGLYEGWKANIAMAYIDQERWYKQTTGKKTLTRKDKHTVANLAAEYFLNNLIS